MKKIFLLLSLFVLGYSSLSAQFDDDGFGNNSGGDPFGDTGDDGFGGSGNDGFGGGDECIGDGDDFASVSDAGRHQGKPEGVGAGGQTHAVFAFAKFCKFLLKTRYLRPADEGGVFHGFG